VKRVALTVTDSDVHGGDGIDDDANEYDDS
jgi:hypothetical protein